jgi:hypothetical protein
LSADATAVQQCEPLSAADRRLMLPIEEVAALLDVSVALLKRQHLANPDEYPAQRIGVLWRIPRAWVEARTAWPREVR